METPNRQVTSAVDFGGRLRRTANVQDHVPCFLLRRIDAKRHLSPPCPVDRRENLAETLAILLGDVHDSEVQVEFIVRWLPAMEFQRNPSIELVLELFEPILQVTEELLVLKGFERIEVWHVPTCPYNRPRGSREVCPNLAGLHRRRVCVDRCSRGWTDDLARADVETGSMPRALHDESRESSFAQRPSQMRAGIVQAIHLAAHLEQGKSPPTYLHTFCTLLGDVLFRRQPNSHEIAYSPRLEKGAPRCAVDLASSRDGDFNRRDDSHYRATNSR